MSGAWVAPLRYSRRSSISDGTRSADGGVKSASSGWYEEPPSQFWSTAKSRPMFVQGCGALVAGNARGRPPVCESHRRCPQTRLEHRRGAALDFRSRIRYTARSLLDAGGIRPGLSPELRRDAFSSLINRITGGAASDAETAAMGGCTGRPWIL